MKKLFPCFFVLLLWNVSFSQAYKSNNNATNFIIGLPKITTVQLEFLKTDLLDLQKIINAEYIFKESCLIIQSDFKTTEPLKYQDIEKVLLKYFAADDIYNKSTDAFDQMVLDNVKSDKFIIKITPL